MIIVSTTFDYIMVFLMGFVMVFAITNSAVKKYTNWKW